MRRYSVTIKEGKRTCVECRLNAISKNDAEKHAYFFKYGLLDKREELRRGIWTRIVKNNYDLRTEKLAF